MTTNSSDLNAKHNTISCSVMHPSKHRASVFPLLWQQYAWYIVRAHLPLQFSHLYRKVDYTHILPIFCFETDWEMHGCKAWAGDGLSVAADEDRRRCRKLQPPHRNSSTIINSESDFCTRTSTSTGSPQLRTCTRTVHASIAYIVEHQLGAQ